MLSALEWPADLALRPVIFTYRTVGIAGVFVSTIILVFLFLYSILFVRKGSFFNKFIIWGILILCSAIGTGVIGIVFGEYRLWDFIKGFQYWVVLTMSVLIAMSLETHPEIRDFKFVFEKILLGILSARAVVVFLASYWGILKGMYGGIAIFSYDAFDLLLLLLIFAYDNKYSFTLRVSIALCWLLGILSNIFWGGSGKMILVTGGVLVVLFFRQLFLNKNILNKGFGLFFVFTLSFGLILIIPTVLQKTSFSKVNLLKYKKSYRLNGYNPYVLPPSPRDRVLEFYNICSDCANNPLYALFGKGFGGYFQDTAFYYYSANCLWQNKHGQSCKINSPVGGAYKILDS